MNEDKTNPTKLTKKENIIQTIKFALFSAGAGIIQVLSFTLLFELVHFPYWPAYLIALILSVLFNFTVNRKFTFKSSNNVPIAMMKVLLYYCFFTPLSTIWGDLLEKAGWNEYIILGGTMLINFVTEYLFQRFFVYKNSINSAVKKEIKVDVIEKQ